MSKERSWPLWIFLAGMFGLTVFFHNQSTENSDKNRFLSPPPEHIEWFHFGFRDSMADSLWLRWIQDSGVCQTYKGASSSAAQIPEMEGNFKNVRHKVCDNSWSFKMLDAITKLSPLFDMPYMLGAMTLAVEVEDYDGATVILNRGIETFPKNWQLLYRASFHFLFDVHDLPRAADLLNRVADNGGPYWTRLLAARVNTKAGQAQLAISNLEAYIKTVDDPERKKVVQKRLDEIRKRANEERD